MRQLVKTGKNDHKMSQKMSPWSIINKIKFIITIFHGAWPIPAVGKLLIKITFVSGNVKVSLRSVPEELKKSNINQDRDRAKIFFCETYLIDVKIQAESGRG